MLLYLFAYADKALLVFKEYRCIALLNTQLVDTLVHDVDIPNIITFGPHPGDPLICGSHTGAVRIFTRGHRYGYSPHFFVIMIWRWGHFGSVCNEEVDFGFLMVKYNASVLA